MFITLLYKYTISMLLKKYENIIWFIQKICTFLYSVNIFGIKFQLCLSNDYFLLLLSFGNQKSGTNGQNFLKVGQHVGCYGKLRY